jgi:hypothetical protein
MVDRAFTGVIRSDFEFWHMNRLHNLLTFSSLSRFEVTAPMGHKPVFSKIWSFLRSNSYFYFILSGAFGFAMDIPATEESGLQKWRYFCESIFSLKSFQVPLLSFERLSGHHFPLLNLFFQLLHPYDTVLSTVYFLYPVSLALRLMTCLLRSLHWIAWLSFLFKSCLKETKLYDVNDEYSCFLIFDV